MRRAPLGLACPGGSGRKRCAWNSKEQAAVTGVEPVSSDGKGDVLGRLDDASAQDAVKAAHFYKGSHTLPLGYWSPAVPP